MTAARIKTFLGKKSNTNHSQNDHENDQTTQLKGIVKHRKEKDFFDRPRPKIFNVELHAQDSHLCYIVAKTESDLNYLIHNINQMIAEKTQNNEASIPLTREQSTDGHSRALIDIQDFAELKKILDSSNSHNIVFKLDDKVYAKLPVFDEELETSLVNSLKNFSL